ncbi:MAG: DUF1298 domain-containing protein [Actinobacteria bacterium]|nr:MAG: DUF1298 domain-containing protein [Actinomycetota bacterium]RIK08379.1 MAG: hypothetical protein DCC48_00020 [Acidobacteriota bacterium]
MPEQPPPRMSDLEALMWTLEKDPAFSSAFANLTILDRPPDIERLMRRLDSATHEVPRLRQRVIPAFGRLAPPAWRADPDFDITYHIRRVALIGGTRRELFDYVAKSCLDPFDRSRPLWEFVVIEGLEGGKAALLQRIHHTITDGEGGVRMSEQFIDLERDPSGETRGDAGDDGTAAADRATSGTAVLSSTAAPSLVETLADTVTHRARRGLGILARTASSTADAVVHPNRTIDYSRDLASTTRSLLKQVRLTQSSLSPMWGERSLRRHFDALEVPFDGAKRAAKALGGSLNDFFVAGAAGGAGRYHAARGQPVQELRMAMPVSIRTDKSAGGNRFSPTTVVVPSTVDDPRSRFERIHEILDVTKHDKALDLVEGLSGAFLVLPTLVLIPTARRMTGGIDFTTSNVRAAPFEVYIAGSLVEANYPVGPLGGTAFNLTMMSYRGQLQMGLNTDAGAIDEPDLLRDCIEDSYRELIELA